MPQVSVERRRGPTAPGASAPIKGRSLVGAGGGFLQLGGVFELCPRWVVYVRQATSMHGPAFYLVATPGILIKRLLFWSEMCCH